jgi:uncharacterized protein YcbX
VVEGTVVDLWRYPVKSMAGERLRSTRLDGGGLVGDRAHALSFEHKGARRSLTAREAPRLLAWHAGYPFAADAALKPGGVAAAQVTDPSGRAFRWGDPRLRRALEADLGRALAFERAPDGSLQDLPRSVLVTTEASRRALESELGASVDLRRFRTNVHLDLDAAPWAEEGWEGAILRFDGGVQLRLLHPCERCVIPTRSPDDQGKWPELLRFLHDRHDQLFGINARVMAGGRVAVGATAELEPPST